MENFMVNEDVSVRMKEKLPWVNIPKERKTGNGSSADA